MSIESLTEVPLMIVANKDLSLYIDLNRVESTGCFANRPNKC